EPRLDRFYRYILFNKIPDDKDRWCEKTPANVRHFDKILSYYNNNVKLIHIVRDGRDVMLSKHPKKPNSYWVSPERWVSDVKAGLKFEDHPNVFTVKYENIILNYSEVMKDLCNFIGETFTDELKDWYANTVVKKNKAWDGKVKKLHSNSIAKYKNTSDKKRVKEIMSNEDVVSLLKKLNYEVN
ncbi:MAG: sulfotransferase family protein, partial [Candidatus Woesearchaeota archaeon]